MILFHSFVLKVGMYIDCLVSYTSTPIGRSIKNEYIAYSMPRARNDATLENNPTVHIISDNDSVYANPTAPPYQDYVIIEDEPSLPEPSPPPTPLPTKKANKAKNPKPD